MASEQHRQWPVPNSDRERAYAIPCVRPLPISHLHDWRKMEGCLINFSKMNCELMLPYDTPAYMFNVHKNQLSRQTGSRNLTDSKTFPAIWHTYMKLVTKFQNSAINSCWEKCDEKYLGRTEGRTDVRTEGRTESGKTVYPPPVEWGYKYGRRWWGVLRILQYSEVECNCVRKITEGLHGKYSTLWQHKCESPITVLRILCTMAGGPLRFEPLGFCLSSLSINPTLAMTFDCHQKSIQIWVVVNNLVFHSCCTAPSLFRNLGLKYAWSVALSKHVSHYGKTFRIITWQPLIENVSYLPPRDALCNSLDWALWT